MRISTLFFLIIFLLAIISACGIYKEPCEGVGQVNISEQNS